MAKTPSKSTAKSSLSILRFCTSLTASDFLRLQFRAWVTSPEFPRSLRGVTQCNHDLAQVAGGPRRRECWSNDDIKPTEKARQKSFWTFNNFCSSDNTLMALNRFSNVLIVGFSSLRALGQRKYCWEYYCKYPANTEFTARRLLSCRLSSSESVRMGHVGESIRHLEIFLSIMWCKFMPSPDFYFFLLILSWQVDSRLG